ncbi:hypothetical protein JDV02_000212 [Purpureocillium takamizusanense]|uniref:Dynamin N-terminal domain-containing protein n=1 Tax=Purpureocillium takamizusanense TaxID=2060973 RepID=A0A9Q8Q6I8_9HYPO|nr:uncharacterized protein JDV02_000212 [Purpureocillium takamizusanense]UNI13469.1 hypothetical protein JDV02_000212 [Purpureocillium takamizusanense]
MAQPSTDMALVRLESLSLDDGPDQRRDEMTRPEPVAEPSGVSLDISLVSTNPDADPLLEHVSSPSHHQSGQVTPVSRASPESVDESFDLSFDFSFASTASGAYVFGQPSSRLAPPSPTPAGREQAGHELFTFRSLHNITPEPRSTDWPRTFNPLPARPVSADRSSELLEPGIASPRPQPAAAVPASDATPATIQSSSASTHEQPSPPVAPIPGRAGFTRHQPPPDFSFEPRIAPRFRRIHPLPARSASRSPRPKMSPDLPKPGTFSLGSQPDGIGLESESAPTVQSSPAATQEQSSPPVSPPANGTVSSDSTPQPPTQPIPYDAKDEAAPAHELFTSTFQDALKDGRKISEDAVAAIEGAMQASTAASTVELRQLLHTAKALTSFECTDTRTIAVLGDSGEGKSSLINALLHCPGVAQTSDAGSACTSVVTEYRQKKAEHSAPITVEVDYLSASEIEDLIRELLYSYRQLFLPLVNSSSTSEEDFTRCERESEKAWSTLQAAFKHKTQFTENYARDTSEGAVERISSQLIQWANELEWPDNGRDGRWVTTATTAEECVEQTKRFAQDKYWPFTKIIRVYLSSQVLKTGVVLADLPGLHDTNLARVRATQDYLLKCDNILIVAKISRAITDQSLKSSLFYVLSRHMPLEWDQSGAQRMKIAVVCTKAEEININTARTEFCGPGKIISTETMKQLDDEIDKAKASGDRKRKKRAKLQQQLALIRARAQHVKENLQLAYSSKMRGSKLEVFCVSSAWYEKYCPKGNVELVQGSGIPDLRRFCHTVVADIHLNEAKQFLKPKLSGLLNSLDLYARSNMTRSDEASKARAGYAAIVKDLDGVVRENKSLADTFRRDCKRSFEDQILTFFDRRGHHWEAAATNEGRKWDSKQEWHSCIPQPNPEHLDGLN